MHAIYVLYEMAPKPCSNTDVAVSPPRGEAAVQDLNIGIDKAEVSPCVFN